MLQNILVKAIESTNTLTLFLEDRIDTTNAPQIETEIFDAVNKKHADSSLVLDAAELTYISSVGLRVLLKLAKTLGGAKKLPVINVSRDVYDIFEMSGFTNILDVKKALREVSVDGCELIGQGANGKVYRLDAETIIKVFRPTVSYEAVKEERDVAQAAFVAGVPTAISYDVVKCGDAYGAVYEMLNAKTVGQVIKENPERAEELGTRMGKLLKDLHSTQADTKKLNNMLDVYKTRCQNIAEYYTSEEIAKLKSVYDALPEVTTMLHGDFHTKNIMLSNEELIFIDMGDVGYGHPLLDLGSSYLPLTRIGKINPAMCEAYVGISADIAHRVWMAMTDAYFGENAERGRRLAEIYGEAKYVVSATAFALRTGDPASLSRCQESCRVQGLLNPSFDISEALTGKL